MARTATKVRFTEPGEQKDGGLFVEEEEEGSIEKVINEKKRKWNQIINH